MILARSAVGSRVAARRSRSSSAYSGAGSNGRSRLRIAATGERGTRRVGGASGHNHVTFLIKQEEVQPMSLALVQISVPVFQEIRDHLVSHYPNYRNMHLREARYRNKKRVLHYLHALHAPRSGLDVEGMISGPDVFWHYQMSMASRTEVHLRVLSRRSSAPSDARIYRHFLPEIVERIQQEKAGSQHHPKLTPGQFYLRRGPGMSAAHPNCRAAVASGELDQRFVSQLHAWDLWLLRP